jgi:hypothetical protein
MPRKKSPVTRPGIDPGTSFLVAQCLNHYATPGPFLLTVLTEITCIFFWGGGSCWCEVVGFNLLQWCGAEGICCTDHWSARHLCAVVNDTKSFSCSRLGWERQSNMFPGNLWILPLLRRSYGYCHQIFMPFPWSRMLNKIIRNCNETVSVRNDVCMRQRSGMSRDRGLYQRNVSSAILEGRLGIRSVWRGSSTSVLLCNHRKEFRFNVNMTL